LNGSSSVENSFEQAGYELG